MTNNKWKDKDWLYEKYIKNKMSLRDVAKAAGVSCRRTVKKALLAANIPIRNLKEARNNRTAAGKENRKLHINAAGKEKYIIDEYVNKKRSMRSIYKELNTTRSAVLKVLKSNNILIKNCNEVNIGRKNTQKTKAKMSATASQQIINNVRSSHSNGILCKCKTPNQGVVTVRSSWERDYINYLTNQNIDFFYENKVFKLKNGKSYIPDFYLPKTNEYIEIKGYLSPKQEEKYNEFKQEYPHIKWKMLKKEDLKDILLKKTSKELDEDFFLKRDNPNPSQPTIYIVSGIAGSGKSWVCNQLTGKFNYVSYDENRKKTHLDLLRSTVKDKIALYDLNIKTSTFIRRHSHEFNIHFVTILGDFLQVKKQLKDRGGKITKSTYKRWKVMQKRAEKYGEFSGSSQEVYNYLKQLKTP